MKRIKEKLPFKAKAIPYRHHNKFVVAMLGLVDIFKHEFSFRFQVLSLSLVFVLGLILKISAVEWISIVVVSSIVLISEAFNTAIENTLDMINPEYNKIIGQIKDICAGAVLLGAIQAFIVGCIIFIPKLIILF